jgi:hypothetical protein
MEIEMGIKLSRKKEDKKGAENHPPHQLTGHSTWAGGFSVEEHYIRLIRLLNEVIHSPLDWIVIADTDEMQMWPENLP